MVAKIGVPPAPDPERAKSDIGVIQVAFVLPVNYWRSLVSSPVAFEPAPLICANKLGPQGALQLIEGRDARVLQALADGLLIVLLRVEARLELGIEVSLQGLPLGISGLLQDLLLAQRCHRLDWIIALLKMR